MQCHSIIDISIDAINSDISIICIISIHMTSIRSTVVTIMLYLINAILYKYH